MTKKIEFKESVAILLIMLIILGSGVIGFGLSPQVPVLTVIAFLVFWLAGWAAARRTARQLNAGLRRNK